jgi:hypothetical protein
MSFLVDATRPFATSFIKQNLQFAQDRFNSLNSFPVGADKGWKLSELNVGQIAFYAQDDWSVNDDLN